MSDEPETKNPNATPAENATATPAESPNAAPPEHATAAPAESPNAAPAGPANETSPDAGAVPPAAEPGLPAATSSSPVEAAGGPGQDSEAVPPAAPESAAPCELGPEPGSDDGARDDPDLGPEMAALAEGEEPAGAACESSPEAGAVTAAVLSAAVPAGASAAPEPRTVIMRAVGVKFQRACKTYFFNAGILQFNIGEHVIVETDRGLGLARVVTPVVEIDATNVPGELKRVIRKANWNDLERDRKNKDRETEALRLCVERIQSHNLPMKLVRVEYLHDASKAVFFFTAEQRVDFRELVKDLARQLHTRIEMRQIGVRDESKIVGGLGPCGREVCCSTFLTDFSPVSVRMAKDQNLAMNPSKVSGLCGRLMCCLSFEHQLYQELVRSMPKKGKNLRCDAGCCRVIDLNILSAKVLVELESGKTMFVPAAELRPLDQPDQKPAPEPPVEEVSDDEILESDDPRVLEKMESQARPSRPERTRPRPEAPTGAPVGNDQRPEGGRERQERPRERQDRPERPGRPERDDRRGPARTEGDRRGPARPESGRREPPRPEGRPRTDRPLAPPPSTVAYHGKSRPPGAQQARPERRNDQDRRDQPREQPRASAPPASPTASPPAAGEGGTPPGGQPGGEHKSHHRNRRRRNR
jgi:cell fate regulator YaaT (PSP1 superfamily)